MSGIVALKAQQRVYEMSQSSYHPVFFVLHRVSLHVYFIIPRVIHLFGSAVDTRYVSDVESEILDVVDALRLGPH